MISIALIIAIGILIVLAFMLFRVEHMGRKVKIVSFIIIGLLLYFSIMSLFSSQEVDLKSPRGIVQAVYVYFGWLGQTAGNLWDVGKGTVTAVGNAIKLNVTSGK